MFLTSIIVLAAIGLPMGLACSLVTHDLNRLVLLTSIGTVAAFLFLVVVWRWARSKDVDTLEARTPWLNTVSEIDSRIEAWRFLRGEPRRDSAAAAPAAPAQAQAANDSSVSPAGT
jgi:hypothetical protein